MSQLSSLNNDNFGVKMTKRAPIVFFFGLLLFAICGYGTSTTELKHFLGGDGVI